MFGETGFGWFGTDRIDGLESVDCSSYSSYYSYYEKCYRSGSQEPIWGSAGGCPTAAREHHSQRPSFCGDDFCRELCSTPENGERAFASGDARARATCSCPRNERGRAGPVARG